LIAVRFESCRQCSSVILSQSSAKIKFTTIHQPLAWVLFGKIDIFSISCRINELSHCKYCRRATNYQGLLGAQCRRDRLNTFLEQMELI